MSNFANPNEPQENNVTPLLDAASFVTPPSSPGRAQQSPGVPLPRRRERMETPAGPPRNRRRLNTAPLFQNAPPNQVSPSMLDINWNMSDLDEPVSPQQISSSESPMISSVRNEYQEMTRNNVPVIQKYTGTVDLDLEIVDLYDLTYDDDNNKIPGISNADGFLKHNPDNKSIVNKALNDKNMVKIGCKSADGRLNPQNIMKDKPYVMLKPIGLYGGVITVLQIFGIIEGNQRLFHVSKTNQTLASTVSLSVLDGGNRVSASHCQAGQEEIVYNLEYIDQLTTTPMVSTPMEVTGGKKKRKSRKERKNKKTRKGKKVRKTRRSRK